MVDGGESVKKGGRRGIEMKREARNFHPPHSLEVCTVKYSVEGLTPSAQLCCHNHKMDTLDIECK